MQPVMTEALMSFLSQTGGKKKARNFGEVSQILSSYELVHY